MVDLKDKKVLLGILDTIDNMFNSTEKTVKKYVQDKSIDLNDRWEIFCKAGNLGLLGTHTYYFHPKGVEFKWNREYLEVVFYIRKHEGYDVIQLLADIKEKDLLTSEEEYKESCMQEFVFEAINNW